MPPEGECSAGGNKWVADSTPPNYGYCIQEPHHSMVSEIGNAIASGAATAWNNSGGNVVHPVAQHTLGVCLGGSAAFAVFGEAEGCFALVSGRPTFFVTAGGGGASPTASVTGGILISNAHSSQELSKWFGFSGASVDLGASVGDQVSFGQGDCDRAIWENETTIGVGLDLPVPFEYHGGASYTWTWTP
jgi:CheC-like family